MDGDGPVPLTFRLSRLCEEFNKSPLEILRELEELPVGMLEEIVEARAYAVTYHGYMRSQQGERYEHPMLTMVKEIEYDLALVATEAAKEAEHG